MDTNMKYRIKHAAIMIKDDGILITIAGRRHHECFAKAKQYGINRLKVMGSTQGFVDATGAFYTREEAAKVAYECKQIPEPKDFLTSEDLW